MKDFQHCIAFFCILLFQMTILHGQTAQKVTASIDNWTVVNREVSFEEGVIHLDAKESDGKLWIKNSEFHNGTIEFEVKGKDTPGRSFVGFAFHGTSDETFDAIYFRPFNFKNLLKKSKSVQYISMPNNDWAKLRQDFPGKYESEMKPTPATGEDWFQVKIEIRHPQLKVYINGSAVPTLEVDQLNTMKNKGHLGFWVGNNSEGWFKNLRITRS